MASLTIGEWVQDTNTFWRFPKSRLWLRVLELVKVVNLVKILQDKAARAAKTKKAMQLDWKNQNKDSRQVPGTL